MSHLLINRLQNKTKIHKCFFIYGIVGSKDITMSCRSTVISVGIMTTTGRLKVNCRTFVVTVAF